MRTYVNSKGRKLALCVAIAVFVTFLVVGTSLGGKGSGAGSGSGPEHPATTEQCILCHPDDLRYTHTAGCDVCHTPPGREIEGASFDCLSCHEEGYDATVNLCFHDSIESHKDCVNCHRKCW